MTALDPDNGKHVHGEFKVPGGKLVIADLEISDSVIARANINGDFFLEPDNALDDINAALEGLPHNSSHSTVAEAVKAALDDSVVMFGFDAHAVATPVRGAPGFATSWNDHDWEIIFRTKFPTSTQERLDHVLTKDLALGW